LHACKDRDQENKEANAAKQQEWIERAVIGFLRCSSKCLHRCEDLRGFRHNGRPIARSLDAIGDWWSLLIIRDSLLEIRRSSEFQKTSDARRTSRRCGLRTLVDQGILKTAPASDGSAYQEYVLTPKGRGVFPVLVALRQWSEEFSGDRDGFPTLLVDRNKGQPVRKLELRARDGRLLGDGDIKLKPNSNLKRRPRRAA